MVHISNIILLLLVIFEMYCLASILITVYQLLSPLKFLESQMYRVDFA